ncbi:MAG TPA: hypothetical protein VN914_08875 [Polyangia bacterium]|nr:hypothetical protein [Polyangia bacterium]
MGPRVLWAALAAFAGLTLAWFLCGLLSGGDFLGGGSPLPYLLAVAGAGLGGWLGAKARARGARVAIAAAALAALLFWVAVPNGWWALPPPRTAAPR